MGIEDAGTMAWLLRQLCVDRSGTFTLDNYDKAVEIYERIRIPRTGQILDCSKELGRMNELRHNQNARREIELMIQGELMVNGTLPIMFQGACHHYKDSIDKELKRYELEQERIALSAYMPGMFEPPSFEEEKKRDPVDEEEIRLAFEALFGQR